MGSLKLDHELENDSHMMVNPLYPEKFRRQGHMLIDFIADYYQNIESYKVLSQVEPGYLKKLLPESAPYYPESIETIVQDVQNYIIPGITHWQSLSTGFNVVGFNWMSSPAATELECNGGGVLQGTTCEAILFTLAAARDQMLKCGSEQMEKLVVYESDQTHSALQKAAQIAGIHTKNFRAIKTTKSNSFGLYPNSLRGAVHADVDAGLVPFFLCATVGTTSTNAIEPIGPLCEVAKDFNIWVHVDAAYAGSACICPEFRHFIDGIEGANSFTLNAQ
nr:tyrosine/dopa decarboxylase 3 [Quercus suber]